MNFNNVMGGLMENLEKKSKENNTTNENDYLDDEGLLMCGHCHTRKQVAVRMFWGELRTPYCLCKCAAEKLKEHEEEIKRKEMMNRIKELRKTGFPDKEMMNYTFENDDHINKRVSLIAKRYVDNFPRMLENGKGLIFYGNVGTGKTFLAACIANALIDKGYSCMVTNFARLINTLGGMFEGRQKYIDTLNSLDLLVIDDLAAERDTEYMNEVVHNIIDSRYRSGKPLIVTTNLSKNELHDPVDLRKQRTYSRLKEMSFLVKVEGFDRRRRKSADDYLEYKSLLGL